MFILVTGKRAGFSKGFVALITLVGDLAGDTVELLSPMDLPSLLQPKVKLPFDLEIG